LLFMGAWALRPFGPLVGEHCNSPATECTLTMLFIWKPPHSLHSLDLRNANPSASCSTSQLQIFSLAVSPDTSDDIGGVHHIQSDARRHQFAHTCGWFVCGHGLAKHSSPATVKLLQKRVSLDSCVHGLRHLVVHPLLHRLHVLFLLLLFAQ